MPSNIPDRVAIAASELLPNALLILAALDRYAMITGSASPKTYEIGALIDKPVSWVLRHGRQLAGSEHGEDFRPGYATFSPNGHCWLEPTGREIAFQLRAVAPPEDAGHSRLDSVSAVHGCFRLFRDGRIERWVPDHLPGHPRVVLSARSDTAQHHGQWIRVIRAGEFCGRYWQSCIFDAMEPVQSRFQDGAPASPEDAVAVCRRWAWAAASPGRVLACANGNAIVEFPERGIVAMPTAHLIKPGADDTSDLSETQLAIYRAIQAGEAIIRPSASGMDVMVGGRKVLARTVEILAERGLVPVSIGDPGAMSAGCGGEAG